MSVFGVFLVCIQSKCEKYGAGKPQIQTFFTQCTESGLEKSFLVNFLHYLKSIVKSIGANYNPVKYLR